ncbi:UDP-3-O-(3-hydroxymyristoyl)glucosamine N-acyltransferase [Hoeflea sp. Naph1]|uniref:UDP-3-O-(3-hydroxymyristoyl)glucosamine N-acyltransferase n=1 Tax=Hoeflea sp. Naph1 TaxID=3388653 RepID=UPI00398F92BA
MDTTRFFPPHEGISLSDLAGLCGAELADPAFAGRCVTGLAPVSRAGSNEITFVTSRKSLPQLRESRAGAVFVPPRFVNEVPVGVAALIAAAPQTAFALAGAALVPAAMTPSRLSRELDVAPGAIIDPSARLEDDVVVEAGAIIGAGVEIGRGSIIAAGVAIGPECRIGRDCHIAHGVTVQHTLIGNNVIIHPGARIGQDGFGYAPGPRGLVKLPQIGRVILQDHVEIGANTTIDRGALDDTVIGEGTKIDNQVQIGHNVRIGRHCVLVAKVAVAGSTTIGNGVMIGGAAGIAGHLTIGDGAQLAAMSGVASDVPAGARWGGQPARPMRGFLRDAAEANARAFGKADFRKSGEDQ